MLIKIKKLKKRKEPKTSFSEIENKNDFISSQNNYLAESLKSVDFKKENATFHFTSNGRFALHDIVIFSAKSIGSANAYISSFNISVIAANSLLNAFDKGMFKSLAFILNAQKKHNFKKAIDIIEDKFPITFVSIHAKVALVWNDKQFITIFTSGNLSNNNNYERGFISTSKQIFDFDKHWMEQIFKKNT